LALAALALVHQHAAALATIQHLAQLPARAGAAAGHIAVHIPLALAKVALEAPVAVEL